MNRQAVLPPSPQPSTISVQPEIVLKIMCSNTPFQTPIRREPMRETLVFQGNEELKSKRQTHMEDFTTAKPTESITALEEDVVVDLTVTPLNVSPKVVETGAKNSSGGSYDFHLDLEDMSNIPLYHEKEREEQILSSVADGDDVNVDVLEEAELPVTQIYFPPIYADINDPYEVQGSRSSNQLWPRSVRVDEDEEAFERRLEQAKILSLQESAGTLSERALPRVGYGLDHRSYQQASTLMVPRLKSGRQFQEDEDMARELQRSFEISRTHSASSSSSSSCNSSSSSSSSSSASSSVLPMGMGGREETIAETIDVKEKPAFKMGASSRYEQGVNWKAANPGTDSERRYQVLQQRKADHVGTLTLKPKHPADSISSAISAVSRSVPATPKRSQQRRVTTPPTPDSLGHRRKLMVVRTTEVLGAQPMQSHIQVLQMLDANLRDHPEYINETPCGRSYYLIQPEADNITYKDIKVLRTEGYGGYHGKSKEVGVGGRNLQVGGCLLYHGRGTTSKERDNLLKSALRDNGTITDYLAKYIRPDGVTCYTDAHPRHALARNWDEDCWPAAYINQANRKELVNCVLDVCPPLVFAQMRKDVPWFDPEITLCMVITRKLYGRNTLWTDYGYTRDAQMAAKCGFLYQKYLDQLHMEEIAKSNEDIQRYDHIKIRSENYVFTIVFLLH